MARLVSLQLTSLPPDPSSPDSGSIYAPRRRTDGRPPFFLAPPGPSPISRPTEASAAAFSFDFLPRLKSGCIYSSVTGERSEPCVGGDVA